MRVALVVLGLFLTLFSFACTTRGPHVADCNGHFTYSGFDAETTKKVMNAGHRWSMFTGEAVVLEPGAPSPRCHISPGEIQDIDGKQVVGLHEYPVHNITINAGGPDVEATLLHELGHAYGLTHREDGVIMHPDVHPGGDFNEADHDECERVGVCF